MQNTHVQRKCLEEEESKPIATGKEVPPRAVTESNAWQEHAIGWIFLSSENMYAEIESLMQLYLEVGLLEGD